MKSSERQYSGPSASGNIDFGNQDTAHTVILAGLVVAGCCVFLEKECRDGAIAVPGALSPFRELCEV